MKEENIYDAPKTSTPHEKPLGPRWIGVLLSFFVPAFGMIRAGEFKSALYWSGGLFFSSIFICILIGKEGIPVWVGYLCLGLLLIAQILNYVKSFKKGRMSLKLWLLFIILLIGWAYTPDLRKVFGVVYRVPTTSMAPTLFAKCEENPDRIKDLIAADPLAYLFKEPERGDIILFNTAKVPNISKMTGSKKGTVFIKRIVGMPGERIKFQEGKVLVNGNLVEGVLPDVTYVYPRVLYNQLNLKSREGDEFVVGENEYLVLGDNTENSLDSRYFGNVPREAITGKVTKILFPFHRIGQVNDFKTEG